MNKVIRFLQSKEDIDEFVDFLSGQKVKLYTYHVQEVIVEKTQLNYLVEGMRILPNNMMPIIREVGKYQTFSEDYGFIEFNPCIEKNGRFCHGSLVLHYGDLGEDQNVVLNGLFGKIKKYVQKEYTLSDDKTCYIGHNFMNKWFAHSVSTDFILKRKMIKLIHQNSDRYMLIDFLRKNQYIVESVGDYRKGFNADADILAFCSNEEDLIKTINGRLRSISIDSNCVFMIHFDKYDAIIIDLRLLNENKSAANIFKCLENYINKMYISKEHYWYIE